MDWQVLWRMLVVLAGSTAGLILGSLIHYAFLEDAPLDRGSQSQAGLGRMMFAASILVFLLTVAVLYLNRFPSALVAMIGMMLSKLTWNIGDSYLYASRIHTLLIHIDETEEPLRKYLTGARSYRQIQDLRRVAQSVYIPGSHRMKKLEAIIREVLGPDYPNSEPAGPPRP